MKKIILINGKKRHGKDYLAQMLVQKLKEQGKSAKIMSFADPLKSIIAKTLDITIDDLEKFKNNPKMFVLHYIYEKEKFKEINFRQILQSFGTEAMKEQFGEDVWVNLLKERALNSSANFIIVPDFRFFSEEISPYTVKIINNDIVQNDSHRSENELNNFNFRYTINNTSRIDISPQVNVLVQSLIS